MPTSCPFISKLTFGLALGLALAGPAPAEPSDSENAGAAQPPASAHVSVFQLFLKGGVFMYPLAACSIAAVTLVLDRLLALRRSKVVPATFLPGLRGVFSDRDADAAEALEYCRKSD